MLCRRILIVAMSLAASAAIVTVADANPQQASAASGPVVAAASDLQFALDEVLERFRRETGTPVRVTYGSSGNLTRQIEQGAPYELFLSADEGYVLRLAERGLTRGTGELYAIGRIALFVPRGSRLTADPELRGLAQAVQRGELGRLAIANPEHAPYGRAAEQALRALSLWDRTQPRLLLGENVSQAAQFAASGNADGGIIAYSLVLAPALRDRGSYVLLPQSLHEPLRQRMVLLGRASPAATRLYQYLRSSPSRAILARYGFALPED